MGLTERHEQEVALPAGGKHTNKPEVHVLSDSHLKELVGYLEIPQIPHIT